MVKSHKVKSISRSEVLNVVLLLLFLPEGKVLLEKLNDGFSISESFLVDIIDLLESIRQSLLTKGAGLFVVIHNLIVEHGEVKSQSESDWVASIELLGGIAGQLIVLKSSLLNSLKFVWRGAFGNISVIISNHLVEEGLGLISGGLLHALVLDDLNDVEALIVKLRLDLLLVSTESVVELLVLWVLLNGADSSNGSSLIQFGS